MGMTDHGPVHVRIVSNIALRLLRLLVSSGLAPSVQVSTGLEAIDAAVIVVLDARLHEGGG